MEIVSSVASGTELSVLSSITSMENSCLQTALWSLVKNSSQQKHLPSFHRGAISAGGSLMALDAVLLREAVAVAVGVGDGVTEAEDGTALYDEQVGAWDED
jgi:hypothetical protein